MSLSCCRCVCGVKMPKRRCRGFQWGKPLLTAPYYSGVTKRLGTGLVCVPYHLFPTDHLGQTCNTDRVAHVLHIISGQHTPITETYCSKEVARTCRDLICSGSRTERSGNTINKGEQHSKTFEGVISRAGRAWLLSKLGPSPSVVTAQARKNAARGCTD